MDKVFIIAIVMWWSDATQIPFNDSIEVTHLHGLPLYFKTEEECGSHVNQNLDGLKEFGHRSFPTAHSVKTIYCVETERLINDNNEV